MNDGSEQCSVNNGLTQRACPAAQSSHSTAKWKQITTATKMSQPAAQVVGTLRDCLSIINSTRNDIDDGEHRLIDPGQIASRRPQGRL